MTDIPLADLKMLAGRIRAEASKTIVGQEAAFEQLTVALFVGGHVLLEGVPGTAKTLMARTLATLVAVDFKRVQFTPDLMPSDVVGTNVFDLPTGQFSLKQGPVFTNILLADVVNRAPAKTQAALLEAMEERQVTIDGRSYALPPPFMVVATQNPVEYEGTYPLPEAQLDRFLFKVVVDYPSGAEEQLILRAHAEGFDSHDPQANGVSAVLNPDDLIRVKATLRAIVVDDSLLGYVRDLAVESRRSPDFLLGASPRASIAVMLAARMSAALDGRGFVTPDDVKSYVAPVFRHRVILKPEAEIDGLTPDTAIQRLLARVPVPR